MTIRTVEISHGGPLAQGYCCGFACECGVEPARKCANYCSGRCDCADDRATVRTGPTTTATGRLIESERDGQ